MCRLMTNYCPGIPPVPKTGLFRRSLTHSEVSSLKVGRADRSNFSVSQVSTAAPSIDAWLA